MLTFSNNVTTPAKPFAAYKNPSDDCAVLSSDPYMKSATFCNRLCLDQLDIKTISDIDVAGIEYIPIEIGQTHGVLAEFCPNSAIGSRRKTGKIEYPRAVEIPGFIRFNGLAGAVAAPI